MSSLPLPYALIPLRNPVFRLLWFTWAAANVCMWMNDMAAAWLMTTLTDSPKMVALIQSAATLPVFLLSMPSGALADMLDRRRYLIATQLWVALVAAVLCALTWTQHIGPELLLALIFANGAALAMRGPAFAATVPELVDRAELPAALALNGVAMNGARIIGPVVAGVLIASLGIAWVFALNALVSVLVALALLRWRSVPQRSGLPRESFPRAIRVGLQYVTQSPPVQAILLRVLGFYTPSIGLLAMLPLIVRGQLQGEAFMFTAMLAAMGVGAVAATFFLPRVRASLRGDQLLVLGTALHAGAMLAFAVAGSPWVAAAALLVAGAAWLVVANSLMTTMQTVLPSWVRARGIAAYHTVLMGSNAAGAILWGQVASWTSPSQSLLMAGAATAASLACVYLTRTREIGQEDLSPARFSREMCKTLDLDEARSPVVTTIGYFVEEAHVREFAALMQETRRARLRGGVLSWKLLRDSSNPSHFVEQFVDISWNEMLRRLERTVAHDMQLRDRRYALHAGPGNPQVTILVEEPQFN